MDLLNKYAPIIYFHPQEKYFPVSADFMLKNSTVKDFTDNQEIIHPTNRDLYNLSQKHNFTPLGDGQIVMSIDKLIYKGEIPISNVPIYAIRRTVNNMIYLTYIILFAYNGAYDILGVKEAGQHPGDLEHYTVELDMNENLQRVFFAAHGNLDGKTVNASDVRFENGRIVVYSALNGHGLYPQKGYAFRIAGLANDYLDSGVRWEPHVMQIFGRLNPGFDINTMGWTVYNGRIGGELVKGNKDGIMGLIDKVWYGPNGELIDEFDPKKLNSPPFITETNAKILLVLKDIMLFVFLYFLSYYTLKVSKHYLKGHPEFMVHLTTIASLLFIFYIYRKIAYQLITKYSPQ